MNKLSFSNEELNKIFFTSDTHFYHKRIIEFCNRPFQDEFEMNNTLIENWNKVVPKDGIVFHAGDFIMTSRIDSLKNILDRLNGKIYLTLGNHDMNNRLDRQIVRDMFYQTADMYQFTVFDEEVQEKHINFIITHYPFLYWRRGYNHLHGHVHSGPLSTANENVPFHFMRYDIGVDNNNYIPISYNKLKVILSKNKINNE